ncbi:MAG: PEP-CTERM sorting domain-containing protein [Planctomycetales bacterium]|nr:PEP-CTERM sorting domain-containing protein [Planctomycetales bacterium]
MKRRAALLILFSLGCFVSDVGAMVTTRHYDFEQGTAGANATELIDITDAMIHENSDDFFGWGGHIWIEVAGGQSRPLPAGSLPDVVADVALVDPSLELNEGQGVYVDVSDGSQFDSPAIGSRLAIQFDGKTRYDDFFTGSGSRGVYINPAAYEAGDDVTDNVSESFNLMTQAWVYPTLNTGEKQTVWQAGTEQGSVNITADGFWQFEDLSSVGTLNCTQTDLEKPYSCDEGELEFPVAFNEWTHLGIFRGGNGAEVYINGVRVAGNLAPDPPNFFGGFANLITLGSRDDGTNGFVGLVDDFKVQGEVSLGAHNMDYNIVPSLDGDYNGSGDLDAGDVDFISQAIIDGANTADANGDGTTDAADRVYWIEELQKSYVGDSNFDGEFGSGDFVEVFSAGKYETGEAAGYAAGDWDGNFLFDSSDFVAAFIAGGYEQGPRAAVAAVPEPATSSLLTLAGLSLLGLRRRR